MLNRTSKGSVAFELALGVLLIAGVGIGVHSWQHTPSRDQAALQAVLLDR
jgi:hypothetical protein